MGTSYRLLLAVCLAFSSIASATEVPPPAPIPCADDSTCGEHAFCEFARGACGADGTTGACTEKPEMCTQQLDPVTGCDGKRYTNECDAHSKGVSVRQRAADKA